MYTKRIGVLGGMGPEATVIFYRALIEYCQEKYQAKYDDDYPEIFIYNLPITDMVEAPKNSDKIFPVLYNAVKKLEAIGADFIVMPCNTAHYYHRALQQALSIPFLNIIEETAKKAQSHGYRSVGLLASELTINYHIYDHVFETYGITILVPASPARVTQIIMDILASNKSVYDRDREVLRAIITELRAEGAEAVILGCTDLPILLQPCDHGIRIGTTIDIDIDIAILDTLKILAEATIEFARRD